jgi:hypothetical protein
MGESIPWAQLVKLEITVDKRAQYLCIVQNCEALVHLEVRAWLGEEDWDAWVSDSTEETPIPLKQLKSCAISACSTNYLADMLSMTEAPSLTKLCMSCDSFEEPLDLEQEGVQRFFHLSGKKIKSIEINEALADHGSSIELALHHLPSLTRLRVPKVDFNDALLQALCPGDGPAVPCEHLATIQVMSWPETDWCRKYFDEQYLLRMMRSRTKHPEMDGMNMLEQPLTVKPLKSLYLSFPATLKNSTILFLGSLKSSGLDVRIADRK